jgi:hypothetical protein
MLKEPERGNALRKVESCRKGIGEQNYTNIIQNYVHIPCV